MGETGLFQQVPLGQLHTQMEKDHQDPVKLNKELSTEEQTGDIYMQCPEQQSGRESGLVVTWGWDEGSRLCSDYQWRWSFSLRR